MGLGLSKTDTFAMMRIQFSPSHQLWREPAEWFFDLFLPQNVSFLDLPRELRDQIYQEVFPRRICLNRSCRYISTSSKKVGSFFFPHSRFWSLFFQYSDQPGETDSTANIKSLIDRLPSTSGSLSSTHSVYTFSHSCIQASRFWFRGAFLSFAYCVAKWIFRASSVGATLFLSDTKTS